MKLGPLTLSNPFSKAPKGEIGETGTVVISGMISEAEYNSKLQGSAAFEVWDKMRLGDATVRAALMAIFLPILSAKWFVKSASDSRTDRKIAEFVQTSLMEEMTMTWQEFLRQVLLFLPYGRMLFELVYKDADYEPHRINWKKFAPRLPSTISKWEMQNGGKGITQMVNSGGIYSIPIEKLMIFVNEKEGDNWEGISILRSAYKHWLLKDKLYQIDAMAHERQGLGLPYGKNKPGMTDAQKSRLRTLLENMRANEKGFIEITGDFDVGFMDMKANTTRNPQPSILHHDREISKSVLAQFLELGVQGGSYALSADQSDFFYLSLKSVTQTICDAINKYAIKKMVDYNYTVEKYPMLSYENLGSINFNALSVTLQRLVQVGLVKSNVTTEQFLRKSMGLPELSSDEVTTRLDQEQEELENPTEKQVVIEEKTTEAKDSIVQSIFEMKESIKNAFSGKGKL